MEVLLAQPRGFCAGVERAIETVRRALARYGAPLHVFHEIVHNTQVVDALRAQGAVFVDRVDAVPEGAVLVISAHGVGRSVRQQAAERRLRLIDATCPLVTKVHVQARQYAAEGRRVVLIGHAGHDEVEGTRDALAAPLTVVGSVAEVQALDLPRYTAMAYVTQTTLSVDDTRELIAALAARWPRLRGPRVTDICYATQNRQTAVRALAARVDLVLVVGSAGSSNACRLQEVAAQAGTRAHRVTDADELDRAWFGPEVRRVGITAGASTPEHVVQQVCQRLMAWGAGAPRTLPGELEQVHFRLPAGVDDETDPGEAPYDQRISNSQDGAPIAMQAVSTTRVRGCTSDWNRRSNVAAK